MTTLELG